MSLTLTVKSRTISNASVPKTHRESQPPPTRTALREELDLLRTPSFTARSHMWDGAQSSSLLPEGSDRIQGFRIILNHATGRCFALSRGRSRTAPCTMNVLLLRRAFHDPTMLLGCTREAFSPFSPTMMITTLSLRLF